MISEKVDAFLGILTEAPWLMVTPRTGVDLEFEKHPDRQELINTIKNKLQKFSLRDKMKLVNHLYDYFPYMMQKAHISRNEIYDTN